MNLVELPIAFCPAGKLALTVLASRPSPTHTGFVVWLGDNYDFDGSTPPESYQVLETHGAFAKSGLVTVDYPADTQTIDFDVGLVVNLTGADLMLEEQTGTNGLANDLLVFAGDEILSVVAIQLVTAGKYRLSVVRGRYSTTPAPIGAGTEVFIISRDDLLVLTHATFQPGATITCKVALSSGRFTQDLGEVDPIDVEMAGQAFKVSPSNLTVNGEMRNPRYTASADVKVQWSLPDQRAAITAGFPLKVRTLLEIVSDVDERVLWSKLTFAPLMKITGAKMDTIRAGEPTFTVRLKTDVLGVDYRIQSEPVTLNVTST